MKVAVIEFNQFHDELLPSSVYALNRLGIEPDVYVPSKQPRMDPFALAPGLRYHWRRIGGRSRSRRALARLRGTPSRFTRYDALMMNSIEPVELLTAVSHIDLPTLATLHNANLLRDDDAYRRFFEAPGRLPLFLGRHIAAASGVDDPTLWMTPYFLGEPTPAEPGHDGITTLCVAGNVQFGRRDYAGLVTAVEELAKERSDFVVRIVGRSDWRDGRELRRTVGDRGLGDRFTFTDGAGVARGLPVVGGLRRFRAAPAGSDDAGAGAVLQRQDDEHDVDVDRSRRGADRGGKPRDVVRHRRCRGHVSPREPRDWHPCRALVDPGGSSGPSRAPVARPVRGARGLGAEDLAGALRRLGLDVPVA